jgi:hypothetical protein
MKRRIKITATRRRSWRSPQPAVRALCPDCGREVETLTTAQAAEALEVDAQAMLDLIEAGRVHALATVSGSLRVCRDSLFARGRTRGPL